MSFSLGIVGLPNVGKSTLFQALTKKKVDASNYPFCTIDPNVGVVAVPDERLEKLAVMSVSAKIIPTVIEFVDIAGLVKGAASGEGLGNKFLSNIKEVNAIIQVVRYFNDKDVIHVHGDIDPNNDREVINAELMLADLEIVDRRLSALLKQSKSGLTKEAAAELTALQKIKQELDQGKLINQITLTSEDQKAVKNLNLLTAKPMIYVLNVEEKDVQSKPEDPDDSIRISAKIESQLAELNEAERIEYLHELGLDSTGLDKLIQASYKLLNLITFITTGPEETRAWTVTNGAKAPQAAGVIHTDFEQGFIRAEVINWQTLLAAGSWTKAKELGKIRMEGKEYVLQDGDVTHFHFN